MTPSTLRKTAFRCLLLGILIGTLFSLGPVWAKSQDQERWNKKYEVDVFLFGKEPVPFLKNNAGLLPKGKALDIAMGEGRNGVFLATQGFDVEGWDISPVGLKKAHHLAKEHNVSIQTKVVDLESAELPKNEYDVILMMYYMQRNLFPQIKEALKPGGMAVIETYNVDYLKYQDFRPQWALKTNELLEAFKDFKIIRYQAYDDGKEAYSSIIAQKPME
ncbi:class I SAM-dependent methyltransferase [Nitrospina gracilis]|uniref:class I SAM-dependent methyltransferase n=1 Tax=Nitrospina gracilis TaxID=35801 RepID=UPI001F38426A|nr:methyltransferase domain-containing protein [Nitrospina gracilis]MCF8721475.1 2-polyprenyl-3-methyl-5-hydroxy-6-metoxy-1,4-benzoquinol methylase [Nitrospina gracilis Nb-211]